MTADPLDIRLLRFRSRRDEYPLALATTLLEARRLGEALEVVQTGLAQEADDAALLVLEGRIRFERGDLQQAQAALLRAAKVTPHEAEPYRWLGQVLMKRGQPERAVQVFERALSLSPEDAGLKQAFQRAKRLMRIAGDSDAGHGSFRDTKSPGSSRPSARAIPRPGRSSLPPLPPPRAVPPPPRKGASLPPLGVTGPSMPAAAGVQAQARALPSLATESPPALERARRDSGRREATIELNDDEPTLAAELPGEISSWLEAERSAHGDFSEEEATRKASAPKLSPVSRELMASAPDNSDGRAEGPGPSVPSLPGSGAPQAAEPAWSDEATNEVPVDALESASGFDLKLPHAKAQPVDEVVPPGVHEAESPEQVLKLLETQGIFEGDGAGPRGELWVPEAEAPKSGQRIGPALAVGWVLALACAGGGYYGFTRWVEGRRHDARGLIAQGLEQLRDGQYGSLAAAEQSFTRARALDTKSKPALDLLLFARALRVLDGDEDVGSVRGALLRAQAQGDPAVIAAVEALVKGYEGDAQAAQDAAQSALRQGPDDARVAYLVGRLYQRAGRPEAGALLERASQLDPELSLAWLAQAELARQSGDAEASRDLLKKALGGDGKGLRAELWEQLAAVEAGETEQARKGLSALGARVKASSANDQLLYAVARAQLAIAEGQADQARALVSDGSEIKAREPELSLLLAESALEAGELDVAYAAARAAVALAPGVSRYRDGLVRVLLRRGDGLAVLSLLDKTNDEALVVPRTRAALSVGELGALERAKRELSQMASAPEVKALALRVEAGLGISAESLLPSAQSLARRAGDSEDAWLSVAELAIGARRAPQALRALERSRPGSGETLWLKARALRLSGDPEGALAAYRAALSASPGHPQVREGLAGMLLDLGEFDEAGELYGALVADGYGLGPLLGWAEAEMGRGELALASERLARVPEQQTDSPGVRVVRAKLALAEDKSAAAVHLLEPLVEGDSDTRTADVLSLLGDARYAGGQVDSAAGAYDAALELDPSHPDALVGRAAAAIRADKPEQATELLTRAEQGLATRARSPALRARLWTAQARVALMNEAYAAASERLAEAVEQPGVQAEAFFWYGEALARGKQPGAREKYEAYLEREPKGDYASRAKRALSPR